MTDQTRAFDTLADSATIEKTIASLKNNGISAQLVADRASAKAAVAGLLPEGAEVMNMTSITLEESGIETLVNDSSKYTPVKATLAKMDRATQGKQMQQLGAAPEWVVGSVHAVTEDGIVVIASNTGSQLPAYTYGAQHVIWVVGTQKIVSSLDQAMKRIKDYITPLESVRARKAYGLPETFNSYASKVVLFNREVSPDRVHLIFVNEKLGF